MGMVNVDDRLLIRVTDSELYLLCHITKRLNKEMFCFPSNRTLLNDTGWGIEKLQKVKKSLIDKGYLCIESKFQNNVQTTNTYMVTTDLIGVFVSSDRLSGKQVSTHGKTPPPRTPENPTTNEVLDSIEVLNTDELKSSSPQQPLFSDIKPKRKNRVKKERTKLEKDSYGLLKAIWLKHYPIVGFGSHGDAGAHGEAIYQIIGKLKNYAESKGYPIEPATISAAFDYVLEYIRVRNPGHWCNGSQITTVNSQLTSILHELAVGTTKTVNPNSRNAADIISAFE